jgi:hypothetical protein
MENRKIVAGCDRDGIVKLFILEEGKTRLLSSSNQLDWAFYISQQDRLGCKPGEFMVTIYLAHH